MKFYIIVYSVPDNCPDVNNAYPTKKLIEVFGFSNPINEDTFLYRADRMWIITDKDSGMEVCRAKTKKEVISKFTQIVDRYYSCKRSEYYQKIKADFNKLRKEVENGQCQ